jgi:hypothetical protein
LSIFCVIFGLDYIGKSIDCGGFERATGIETRMAGFSCYAKVDGKFVPAAFVFGKARELRIKQ